MLNLPHSARPRGAAVAVSASALAFAVTACVAPVVQPVDLTAEAGQNAQLALAECRATACETLILDDTILDDLSVLADMPHVTALMMNSYGFESLATLPVMPQLTELHISYTQITDLTPLDRVPNLRVLHAQLAVDSVDFTPVVHLQNLAELAIGSVGTTDLNLVAALPDLQRLSLMTERDVSFEPLRNHASLQTIDLINNEVLDADVFLTLPRLEQISTSEIYYPDADAALFQTAMGRLRAAGIEVSIKPEIPLC